MYGADGIVWRVELQVPDVLDPLRFAWMYRDCMEEPWVYARCSCVSSLRVVLDCFNDASPFLLDLNDEHCDVGKRHDSAPSLRRGLSCCEYEVRVIDLLRCASRKLAKTSTGLFIRDKREVKLHVRLSILPLRQGVNV